MIPGPTPGDLRSPQSGKPPTVGGRASGGFLQYAPLLNPRNSMSITNTKGLLNMPGQNNCFLNSAVQVLWHLDIFRRSFRELCGHACMEDSCIFCALKELFAQFQYSQESALPPDALRRALAETFCDQRRFQLGFMDDAAECFENILMRIHFHIANNESEDMCSALHCIPHQKFAMTLVEQTVCHACGATSEPLPFTQMVHYVPSSALCSQAKLMKEKSDQTPSFSELLKKAGGLGDLRDCPSSCGAAIQIRKTLMNRPEIVSIGLVWDSERPTIEHIMDVFKTIGMSLKLQDVFHSVVDSRWASTATHQLVGIVTYYGKHYSTFFFHTKLRVWIYFDDAAVREIGPKWEQVVEKCCRGHFQPLLLLYANPYGSPVNTSTAPRVITVVPGHKKSINGKESCNILAHDKNPRMFSHNPSSNPRRALTPNPEVSCDISANIQPRRAVTPSGELSWSDEVTNENNHIVKDNSVMYSCRNCLTYNNQPLHHITQNSDQTYSTNTFHDSNDPVKISRISARLSVPNCTFYSDIYQQKPTSSTLNVILNRPASVDDMLKSSINPNNSEVEKVYNQSNEMIPPSTIEGNNTDSAYISRKAVENVLHLQKLQRQRSVPCKNGHVFIGQRNSSSSLESLDNVFMFRDKGLNGHLNGKLEIPDAATMARRRDSGNWSGGDRSSASSSSTTSLDNPYFYVFGNKRLPNGSIRRPGEMVLLTDPGYDSFSLSSSDSYPSAINCSPGKLGQIPEHVQTAFVPYGISQLQYSLKDLKSNDHFPFGLKDDCDKLCAEADIFVAKSIERENVGDISMAALLSDTAAAKARAAMDMPYTSSQALAMAKMKHSMCLIRSSNLHKKMKEAEAALCRKPKETAPELHKNQPSNSVGNSKSNLDNSYKNSKDSEKVSCDSVKDSKLSNSNKSEEHSDKNIEIYATLPKRSLKKKGALSSFVDSLTGEDSSDEKHKEKGSNRGSEESKGEKQKSVNDHEKSKSPNSKKKSYSHKNFNKDSDLSDYSSEWEHTKKPSLYRTYSGPTNSKIELSDLNGSNHSSFSDHPVKKQHRIRRKLMGGFMRRKNRSLPDLREGQDSGSETARSYDDCFFTQTPVSCRKNKEAKNSGYSSNISYGNNQDLKKNSKPVDSMKQPKKITRTNTPPPYKPPPPITHSNSNLSTSPKRVIQQSNSENIKPETLQPNHIVNMQNSPDINKSKNANHLPLCRDIKSHRKISSQYIPNELSAPNTAWLKELQMKQEELNQRKKLQEERERWLTECNQGTDYKLVSSLNSDSTQDSSKQIQPKLIDEKDAISRSPHKTMNHTVTPSIPSSEKDNSKTVRDLASKFENVTLTPNKDDAQQDQNEKSPLHSPHSNNSHLLCSSYHVDNKMYMVLPQPSIKVQQMEHPRLHSTVGHRLLNQKSPVKDSDSMKIVSKERLNGVNGAKQTFPNQFSSGSLYNPHLTDAQLTNVLRIGTNRSSFRNSNGPTDMQDDNLARYPRDVYVLHETKRPDKPPDYETAIQRLELLRSDRNLANFCANSNLMSFEAILEQAKKRRGPKKSVTFSDKVVLVACAGDEDNDFIPNPLLERVYKQHLMQNAQPEIAPTSNEMNQNSKPTKDNNTVETSLIEAKPHTQDLSKQCNQSPCHLCHKKSVDSSSLYCPDCAYYMSRFQQK